ncbi:MAG: repressor LexA [Candidatus Pacebacteria bacterium]|nr:repressor LexA [Candidatus Paceibacterota bacterium]
MTKTTKNEVTKRQRELLEIVYQYIKDTGYPPTFEEMRETLGVSSNQSIIDLLRKLEEKGIIKKGESAARSIKILPLGYKALKRKILVPSLGTSSAGMPLEAIELIGEWETIPGNVEKLKDEVFILKVYGDSMINAGIEDGDRVLVKAQKEFTSGDIVLAQIGGESTIKRFMSENKPSHVYLKPENPEYDIIPFTSEVKLKGKVISILKKKYLQPVK